MMNNDTVNRENAIFTVTLGHSEKSFTALAHMQYDLFCRRNLLARNLTGGVALVVGVMYIKNWWAMLLIAYGTYLITGKYSQANYNVRKMIRQLNEAGLPYPQSEYIFENDRMRVISYPDPQELSPLYYSNVKALGEDFEYYYLFRNENGGYMIPKAQLGDDELRFCEFIEKKTGMVFAISKLPISRLIARIRQKQNEPYHL